MRDEGRLEDGQVVRDGRAAHLARPGRAALASKMPPLCAISSSTRRWKDCRRSRRNSSRTSFAQYASIHSWKSRSGSAQPGRTAEGRPAGADGGGRSGRSRPGRRSVIGVSHTSAFRPASVSRKRADAPSVEEPGGERRERLGKWSAAIFRSLGRVREAVDLVEHDPLPAHARRQKASGILEALAGPAAARSRSSRRRGGSGRARSSRPAGPHEPHDGALLPGGLDPSVPEGPPASMPAELRLVRPNANLVAHGTRHRSLREDPDRPAASLASATRAHRAPAMIGATSGRWPPMAPSVRSASASRRTTGSVAPRRSRSCERRFSSPLAPGACLTPSTDSFFVLRPSSERKKISPACRSGPGSFVATSEDGCHKGRRRCLCRKELRSCRGFG